MTDDDPPTTTATDLDPRIPAWYWAEETDGGHREVDREIASLMCGLHITLMHEEFTHEEAVTLVAAWFTGGFASAPKPQS